MSRIFGGRPLAALTAVTLLATGCGQSDPIYIGLAGPVNAANGVSMKRAAELAVEEINGTGGIDGRLLVLDIQDDAANANRAIEIARDFRADSRIVAVVGHLNSAASLAAAPVYNAPRGDRENPGTPVLQVSPASSAPGLTHGWDWTFRITPTDLEFAPAVARWAVQELGSRRAAVLYANDAYGRGVMTSFLADFQALGGTVVSGGPYLNSILVEGDELDPYLRRAIDRQADALVIGGQAEAGLAIIQAARRLGYTGPVLGADGLTSLKDAGPAGEGVYISSAFLPDRPDSLSREFVRAYRERYDGATPDHRGAMAYDIIYMLRDAIRAVGTDRRAVRDWIARVGRGNDPFRGVSGEVRFDEHGDVQGKAVDVGVVRGGELVSAQR
jgi:branched-chain amino acid transport system substrate-binding protein